MIPKIPIGISETKGNKIWGTRIPETGIPETEISKITKKVKIDDFFSFDAYNRAFSEKTSFFDLFAHKRAKKGSKKVESIGVTLSIFVDFGHFEKLRDFL